MYYLTHGGFLMYFILFMSILGLTGIIERFFYFLKNEKHNIMELPKQIKTYLKENNIRAAIEFYHSEKSSTSSVLKSILIEIYKNPSISEIKLEEKGKERAMIQLQKLDKNMWLISLTAHLTPLLGLLGTVIGMIKAFQSVAMHGTGDPGALANGISEALFTTAGGLFVAIPALIFYNYYNKKIDKIVADIEINVTELINNYKN